jgi:hypothetical protein
VRVVQRKSAPQRKSVTVVSRCTRIPRSGADVFAESRAQDARATSATTWARDSIEILNNYNVTKVARNVSEVRPSGRASYVRSFVRVSIACAMARPG